MSHGTDEALANRKLGDEWQDWDGRDAPSQTRAGKRLFFGLTAALLLLLAGFSLFGWYMIAPRLAQWHPRAPAALLASVSLGFAVIFTLLGGVCLAILLELPLPGRLARAARRLLGQLERWVFSLGESLPLDRDRLAHSFVRTHNTLVRYSRAPLEPSQLLILLPRCLSKQQLQGTRALADRYGVRVAVVPGGELARQRILQFQPRAIIGVACERDLLSGIRDVHDRVPVLGIANARPHGPCKDTEIDLAELAESIEFYLEPPSAGRTGSSDKLIEPPGSEPWG